MLAVAPPAEAKPAFVSLAGDFTHFYDKTAQMPEAARVSAFRAQFNALLPGFYEPRDGQTEPDYDAAVARALATFPLIRAKYQHVAAQFPHVLAGGIAHFRATFPDFQLTMPIYLLHSLSEMDGGTRTIRGRNVMVFGADVIAQLHADASIGPFFDHELFHIYHGQFYDDCDQIRCALWQEGLATYAAAAMNRTSDPHMLMLDMPEPIVRSVDKDMSGALCLVRAKLDATGREDYRPLFMGGKRDEKDRFPRRFGYYIGYLVAKEAARTTPLPRLAKLDQKQATPVIDGALNALVERAGGCGHA